LPGWRLRGQGVELFDWSVALVDLGKLTVEQRRDMFARRLPAVA
jgi:hypothetical protein